MNNLREIKKSRLLHDEAFTYVICSDDRTNNLIDVVNLTNFYDVKFGGFSEQYNDYRVDVISFGAVGGFPAAAQNHFFLLAKA